MIKKNERTAELVGLSFGDGGLTYRTGTKRLRFQLRGDLNEDKEHYDSFVINLFNKEICIPLFDKKVGVVFNKNAGFYGISKESEKLKVLNEILGIPIGVKKELFVPEWIKEDNLFMDAFIRGLFDTDGSISCQRNYSIRNNNLHSQIRIKISSCSRNLIKQIHGYLKLRSFKCLFREHKRKKEGWKNCYEVVLCGGIQAKKWFKEIGSKNPKHITKYLIWKEFGFCPPYTTLKERKQILKKEISPYFYYSGNAGAVKRA